MQQQQGVHRWRAILLSRYCRWCWYTVGNLSFRRPPKVMPTEETSASTTRNSMFPAHTATYMQRRPLGLTRSEAAGQVGSGSSRLMHWGHIVLNARDFERKSPLPHATIEVVEFLCSNRIYLGLSDVPATAFSPKTGRSCQTDPVSASCRCIITRDSSLSHSTSHLGLE